MSQFLFVDEQIKKHTGEEARALLSTESDRKYIRSGEGIVSVDKQRWEKAQRFERYYWMTKQIAAIQDRNSSHAIQFDHYRVLQGKSFPLAVELGCGPFTNLRFIGKVCDIDRCSLEDPLIPDYLKHPNCSFTQNSLSLNYRIHKRNLAVRAARFLLKPFFGARGIQAATALSRRLADKIPISELLAVPIEEMRADRKYDLVVMVNVLEHCQSAPAIFDKILRITNPGACLVFADKLFSQAALDQISKGEIFNAGHPLMPKREYVESFLADHFVPLFQNIHREEVDTEGSDLSNDVLYFIGSKKS